jgi:hypothetical protein
MKTEGNNRQQKQYPMQKMQRVWNPVHTFLQRDNAGSEAIGGYTLLTTDVAGKFTNIALV